MMPSVSSASVRPMRTVISRDTARRTLLAPMRNPMA
jgi:hypothetical protein